MESKHWHELERNGFLSMELVDRVFSKFLRQGVIKEDILDMMELFGLIAKFSSPSLPDVKYFVPCQLRSPPEELRKMEPSSTDPCPLYVHFLVWSMVFSRALSQGRRLGQPGMNHHTCKNSTRMELGLFWRETAYMI